MGRGKEGRVGKSPHPRGVLRESFTEKEGPKGGTEKTLQYAGKALVCSKCQV